MFASLGVQGYVRDLATHVASKLATLTIGAAYVSPQIVRLRRLADQKTHCTKFSGQIALVAHVFYPELIHEILDCYSNLPKKSTLLLTCPPDQANGLKNNLAYIPEVIVVEVANRGRDILPFLTILSAGHLDSFAVVLKLHTKKSAHLLDGNIRRRLLFDVLAGSRRRVATVLSLFENQTTGIVGWRAAWRNRPVYWMTNRTKVEELAKAMNAPLDVAFFEGTMFWVRPAALKRLAGLRAKDNQFDAEAGQLDGTLHHAVERCFALAAAAEGFVTRDVHGRQLYGPPKFPEL